MTESLTDFQRKQQIREQAHANRNKQENKDELSRQIVARFIALPEYAKAATVMFYIDVRSEVRTRQSLPTRLQSGKKIVVPWCNDEGELELFHLTNMDELADRHVQDPRAEAGAARAAREAGRRRGARFGDGARRGVRPPRRAHGARQGLLRQAAAARPARHAAGGAGVRVPAVPRDPRRRRTTSSWTRSSPRRRCTRARGAR